jgi:hypothetical protein
MRASSQQSPAKAAKDQHGDAHKTVRVAAFASFGIVAVMVVLLTTILFLHAPK